MIRCGGVPRGEVAAAAALDDAEEDALSWPERHAPMSKELW
jgi:hypothetical protein